MVGNLGEGGNHPTELCIRDIPDHATFSEMLESLAMGWIDKLGLYSLWPYVIRPTLISYVFQSIGIYFFTKLEYDRYYMEYWLFPGVNH